MHRMPPFVEGAAIVADGAFYCAVTALVAIEVIGWPVALLIADGHAHTRQQHNKSLKDVGEVFEHLV